MRRTDDDAIFQDSDVADAGDMLRAVLIQLFVDNKITFGEFSRRHAEYAMSIGMPVRQIASARNNLFKVMTCKDTLTYNRFAMIAKNILGLNLVNISMLFKGADMTEQRVSINRITY